MEGMEMSAVFRKPRTRNGPGLLRYVRAITKEPKAPRLLNKY